LEGIESGRLDLRRNSSSFFNAPPLLLPETRGRCGIDVPSHFDGLQRFKLSD
jgi:hypothetical protein|tara:strand:- start:138 stop:293 length:156 start_codon:yes stop_codon:yes gene_type:complete